jgi:DNA-binding LacI/PurR family transcriptional regulator
MSKQLITKLLERMENTNEYIPQQFSLVANLIVRDSSEKHP